MRQALIKSCGCLSAEMIIIHVVMVRKILEKSEMARRLDMWVEKWRKVCKGET